MNQSRGTKHDWRSACPTSPQAILLRVCANDRHLVFNLAKRYRRASVTRNSLHRCATVLPHSRQAGFLSRATAGRA